MRRKTSSRRETWRSLNDPLAPCVPISLLPRGYGCHILLELGLAEGRSVGLLGVSVWVSRRRLGAKTYRDEDQLGLAAAESLEGALVAQHNLARLDDEGKLYLMLVGMPGETGERRCGPWCRWTEPRTWTSWGPLRQCWGVSEEGKSW